MKEENVDTQELYNILGVDKKADLNEIKKQFKKSCIKGEYRHPDKGGDPEKVHNYFLNKNTFLPKIVQKT